MTEKIIDLTDFNGWETEDLIVLVFEKGELPENIQKIKVEWEEK